MNLSLYSYIIVVIADNVQKPMVATRGLWISFPGMGSDMLSFGPMSQDVVVMGNMNPVSMFKMKLLRFVWCDEGFVVRTANYRTGCLQIWPFLQNLFLNIEDVLQRLWLILIENV